MSWWRRLQEFFDFRSDLNGGGPGQAVEGASPAIASLLDGLERDPPGDRKAVLDLGPPTESTLDTYSRFAHRVRFAELTGSGPALKMGELDHRLPEPALPYDLVFAWDSLERVPPEARSELVERISEVTAPGARLHLVMADPETEEAPLLHFSLTGMGTMRCEAIGPTRDSTLRLMPGDLDEILGPFQVERRFTLKGGLREYVAVKGTA